MKITAMYTKETYNNSDINTNTAQERRSKECSQTSAVDE
jgi:hypothetical protein